MLVPVTAEAGLNIVALGLENAINLSSRATASVLTDIGIEEVEQYLVSDQVNELLEAIVSMREAQAGSKDILIVKGLAVSSSQPYAEELNLKIAIALDAAIIFVLADDPRYPLAMARQLRIAAASYLKSRPQQLLGYIVNKVNRDQLQSADKCGSSFGMTLKSLGRIPYYSEQSEANKKLISQYLDISWADRCINQKIEAKLSAALFRYRLIDLARKAKKRIVLPEGDEPRTLRAANICAERGIAQCILLAEKNAVFQMAKQLGITLSDNLVIVEPKAVADKYVNQLYELRKHKGLKLEEAGEQLKDNVVLGTMMLQLNEVDGLVSGAVHTTANTIRPAFQIVKTVPDAKIISSVFFMCLPDQVLVYGDCAVNPSPTSGELADIAIQSANSALKFGLTPRVALLSYSTGTSGFGPEVEKVRMAVEIVKQKRPDLAVDGPLQYDAATMPEVAALKAPKSSVAGKANVFIFPDLNAGNIAYKTVQRSTGIICIGPMLQGMRKPVNDLSRGCLVEDIVFTIALTAIQAG